MDSGIAKKNVIAGGAFRAPPTSFTQTMDQYAQITSCQIGLGGAYFANVLNILNRITTAISPAIILLANPKDLTFPFFR